MSALQSDRSRPAGRTLLQAQPNSEGFLPSLDTRFTETVPAGRPNTSGATDEYLSFATNPHITCSFCHSIRLSDHKKAEQVSAVQIAPSRWQWSDLCIVGEGHDDAQCNASLFQKPGGKWLHSWKGIKLVKIRRTQNRANHELAKVWCTNQRTVCWLASGPMDIAASLGQFWC